MASSSSNNSRINVMTRNRIQREVQGLASTLPPEIQAKPDDKNLLHIHYVIFGPKNTPYQGGVYHGVLNLPSEYPMKPPAIRMLTPSGRFYAGKRICLSMSDYHEEQWHPGWSIATILTALLSFMTEETKTVGTIETTQAEKKQLAKKSMNHNVRDPTFRRLFPELVEEHYRKNPGSNAQEDAETTDGKDRSNNIGSEKEGSNSSNNNGSSTEWSSLLFKLLIVAFAIYVAYLQRGNT